MPCHRAREVTSSDITTESHLLRMETKAAAAAGRRAHEGCDSDVVGWFEDACENAGAVQAEVLRRILAANRSTEYLSRWLGDVEVEGMGACALESLYRSRVPLASHADFEPFIQRIADGDTAPLLTQEPIQLLSLSLVLELLTEGKSTCPSLAIARRPLSRFSELQLHIDPGYTRLVKEGGFLNSSTAASSPRPKGGLTAGTATTHYFSSEEFKIKQEQTKSFTCSPEEVISSGDYKQSTYCHLLLGLYFADRIEFITSTFAYSIVQAFRAFEDHWREICSDIRDGGLSPRITVERTRQAMLGIVSPNPSLAQRLEAACEELERKDWCGVIPKLWPKARYVYSIMTGSMQHYLTKLRHYAGGLPLVSADYGSTESWIGVNVDPSLPLERVTFAVVPTFSYFEFIPLHRQKNRSRSKNSEAIDDDFVEDEPVPLSQVKVGQEYEIVLTTFTGLYRYRLGDVVEVAGYHKRTPKLSFICRRKLILTVNIDKNTEKDLQLVVERGSRLLWKAMGELVDFTSHADISKQPGHYVIYWEIKGEVEEKVLGECCREMDASFEDHGYVVSRKCNSIGPLELCIVETGTFRKILDHFIGNGAALSQFKTPRCTSNQVLLSILNVCTVKRFYSTAYS
ncbi:hypothetical protein NL676_017510 [Syzygium grande]|nr:hypothetical protein NL676_017510 [Syzygium grande]